ncbi:hypothetical protein [Pyxidicoccus fallax]|uniref:hypothetical protein n=1 Tax=Pyxidicoccus fallax TaxID=394095 RepID=UPI001FEB31DD|nr:hypothetical protein [Pyxidicoccus fallax]
MARAPATSASAPRSLASALPSPAPPPRGTASPPQPATTPPPKEPSLLATRCRAWAADPRNPWALAHGMVLDGRNFRASDGRLAAEVVVADFLRRAPLPHALDAATEPPDRSRPGASGTSALGLTTAPHDAGTPELARATASSFAAPRHDAGISVARRPGDLFFDAYAPDGTPVEPHPALHLKTLLLAGYPPDHRFRTAWGTVTPRELVEDLKRDFRPTLASSPEGAWALDALSLSLKPGATFRDGTGATVRFDAVMETALATLEAAQAELAAGMKAGRPEVPKRGQGIYAHPCGGLHSFQAVAGWARHPSVRKKWRKRLDAQVDVLLYRLDSETRQYETALASAPAYRLPLLVQMLKFHGHLLETLGRYRDDTGWRPTAAQRQTVERARMYLENTVRRLKEAGAFDNLESLAARQRQLALDLVGDTCHAAHGEALWREGASVSTPAAPAPPR